MTYREIINAVLRRLREDSISTDWSGALVDNTSVNDYHKLIGDLVNEVKREVEDAWNWTALRRTETVSTVSGTRSYALPSTTQRTRITDVQEQSDGYSLGEVGNTWIKRQPYPSSSDSSSKPVYYAMTGVSNGLLEATVHPKPDAVYSLNFYLVDPQDNLSNATDTLTIDSNCVILGAWARAIAERGEDGGSLSDMAQTQYAQALADAIAIDAGRHTDEVTFNAI